MQFVCVWFDLHSDMPFSYMVFFRFCCCCCCFCTSIFRALICIQHIRSATLKTYRNTPSVYEQSALAFSPRPIDLVCSIHQKFDFFGARGREKTRSNHDWVSGLLKRATSSIVIITHHVYENTYYRRSRTPPFVMKKVKSQFWAYFFSNFTNHFPFYKKRCSWYWWSADRDRQKWKKNDFMDERNNFKHKTFVLQKLNARELSDGFVYNTVQVLQEALKWIN